MAVLTRIITVEFTEVKKEQEEWKYFEDPKGDIEAYFRVWHGNIFNDIKVTKIEEVVHKSQPKLTKREKEFCEFMKCGWIARDKEKNLYWYNSKPYKNETTWNNNNSEYICMDLLNTPFAFIQWEYDEPWDVSELRKLEVEE